MTNTACSLTALSATAFALTGLLAQQPAALESEARAILSNKCLQCHGATLQMANLDLRTRVALLKGGAHGPAIVPGNPDSSLLFKRVTNQQKPVMPMPPLPALTASEINVLKEWIAGGAPWAEASSKVAEAESLSKTRRPPVIFGDYKERTITEADRNSWAFRKPVRHPIPPVPDKRWSGNPIDAFIKHALDAKNLEPAPRADRNTLIRRAYLDLVGLLPAPDEVDAFVRDPAPNAYEQLIDRLLASPHYGERWGRMWLDVVRYSDTSGYEYDSELSEAWRFRDYVIKAFNDDKPYDRFVIEQIAGDEVDQPTFESRIATTFHRIGPRVRLQERANPNYRFDYLDEMVRTTFQGFMGLSVNCARCHDHKFDPITQADYYRSVAMFFGYVDYDYPLVPNAEWQRYQEVKRQVDASAAPILREIARLEAPYKKEAFARKLATFPAEVQAAVRTPQDQRSAGQRLLADQVLSISPDDDDLDTATGNSAGSEKKSSLAMSEADAALRNELYRKLQDIRKALPPRPPMSPGVRDGDFRFAYSGKPRPGTGGIDYSRFGIKGKHLPQPGEPYEVPPVYFKANGLTPFEEEIKAPIVEPGFLTVLDTGNHPVSVTPSQGTPTGGRRRALAEWIVSPENPLAARVMINRIWGQHFGTGIVPTPNNFGKMGQPPSHPELLDWLATEFVRQGWSIKQMHRLIMNSETYRMASSNYRLSNLEKDPRNTLLWRFPLKRLEAEVIRDITLAASGQLNGKAGGPGFFPPVPASVRDTGGKGKWVLTEEGPDTWRRSVYSYQKRNMKYPMFDAFDQPDSNFSCERRNVTTVPTQALTLLNNKFFLMQARHLAERVYGQAGAAEAAQVTALYRIALSRAPTSKELDANIAFLRKQRDARRGTVTAGGGQGSDREISLGALTDLAHVILGTSEFLYIG